MKTKKVLLTLLIISIAYQLFSQNIPKDIIKGKWGTPEGDVIEVYEYGGLYYGRIASLNKPVDENGELLKDYYNPVKELRNREIIGIDILIGLSFDGDDEWTDGRIYIPTESLVISCKIEYIDKDRINIVIPLGLFTSETEVWHRKK